MVPYTTVFSALTQGQAFLAADGTLNQKIQPCQAGTATVNAVVSSSGGLRAFNPSDVVTPVLGTVNL